MSSQALLWDSTSVSFGVVLKNAVLSEESLHDGCLEVGSVEKPATVGKHHALAV